MRKQGRIIILVHGGAGSKRAVKSQLKKLKEAIEAGYSILDHAGSSLDAVETAIRLLEDSGFFNAGLGSRLQLDGRCRMDASIMEGRELNAGAVTGIENVNNPIRVARLVMNKTPHVLMGGEGAERLARLFKIQRAGPPTKRSLMILRETLKTKDRTIRLFHSMYGDETVGAIALDRSGNLAAGASTGGIAVMLPGRIGDAPLIGSGVYADNETGAASMTGWGESIVRAGLAKEICCGLKSGISPQKATERALKWLITRINGEAGAIVLNGKGDFAILHITPFMCAGYRGERQQTVVASKFHRIR